MPHPCVVCGRSRMNPNNREEEYMFFGFPVNYDSRCKKWLEFCCREDLYKLTKKQLLQRMVCSKHFERKDFLNEYQDRLNCTAVPSIYDPKQSLYNIACVLCGRARRDPPAADYDGTTFHHFPGEEFRCLKWLDFVGIDSYYRLTRKEILFCYICSRHFDESQFVPGYRGRLNDRAVPNIRSPDKSPSAIEIARIDSKSFHAEKSRRQEPLSTAALESQACAACGRSRADPRNKIERYKFHPFPAYEIGRCLRWCQFLGREDLLKMSPNQIRKLVLCSKHFLAGQSFHKVGPCDAVPTIKEIAAAAAADENTEQQQLQQPRAIETQQQQQQQQSEGAEMLDRCGPKRQDIQRPLVSSKKPKIENKPAPLAKKRGRSKRPTSINIPKVDAALNIENRVRKLPLPPANWRIQIGNSQFQPLAIANSANSANSAITADGKKVILPFAGNISSLGAPIPVHSLSSIPPGFLIKINLPELPAKPAKAPRKPRRRVNDKSNDESVAKPARRRRNNKKVESSDFEEKFDDTATHPNVCQLLAMPAQPIRAIVKLDEEKYPKEEILDIEEEEPEEDDFGQDTIEALDEDFAELANDGGQLPADDGIDEYEEIEIAHDREVESQETKPTPPPPRIHGTRMSSRARRTLLPIRTEVRYFLRKLKPHMRRLPKRTRAQLKLSIVNMVIDRL